MSEADYALARPMRRFVTQATATRWLALPVLLAGTFMIVLDFFIVNVALPAMSGDLHADATAVEWVVAGYGLTLATFLITRGGSATGSDGGGSSSSASRSSRSPRRRVAPRPTRTRSWRRGSCRDSPRRSSAPACWR